MVHLTDDDEMRLDDEILQDEEEQENQSDAAEDEHMDTTIVPSLFSSSSQDKEASQARSSKEKSPRTISTSLSSRNAHPKKKAQNATSPTQLKTTVLSPKSRKPKGTKVPWSKQEDSAVKRQLQHCLVLKKVPQKQDCLQALANEPALKNKDWKAVIFLCTIILKRSLNLCTIKLKTRRFVYSQTKKKSSIKVKL